jgi:hypothetical protein
MNNLNKIAFVACCLAATSFGIGAGKVKFNEFTIKKTTDSASPMLYQDVFIPANANCVLAGISPGARPHVKVIDGTRTSFTHVKVFSGQMSRGSMQVLMGDGSVRSLSVQIGDPPTARSASQNNLKQMSLAAINFADLGVSLLKPVGGKMQEYRSLLLHGVKVKATDRMDGKPAPEGTVEISYTGLEVVKPILVGMLLPAIQKVR